MSGPFFNLTTPMEFLALAALFSLVYFVVHGTGNDGQGGGPGGSMV